MVSFHSKSVEFTLQELKSSLNGLSEIEAKNRLAIYGQNEIKEAKKRPVFFLFLDQFKSFLVIILIVAATISFFIKEINDAILILLIVILNGFFGFFQEYKSEKSIAALKKLSSLKATVIRHEKAEVVNTGDLVPGDIILLEEGSIVPADARLIEVNNLETLESSLTGESTPIPKTLSMVNENTQIADQKNIVFSSTIITKGRGKAVVISTGMNTEIGKIANLIQKQEDIATPLQKKLENFGKKIGISALAMCLIVMLIILSTKNDLLDAFIVSVSLAVAAIPEGLPAIVTLSLAFGVQRMSKKNALIRKLPAVETLGSTNIILSDKTGTLTKNEMTIKKIWVDNEIIDVTGTGYERIGEFISNNKKFGSKNLEFLLKAGIICNNAHVDFDNKKIIGDPTEACLIVSGAKYGLSKDSVFNEYERINEIPFDSVNKYMATFNKRENKKFVFVKGAPDFIIKKCSHILINNKRIRLDKKWKGEISKINEDFSSSALRVMGFAFKDNNAKDVGNLVFLGLQAMIDPPRDNIRDDIERCHKAGIRVKIITGDYIGTAKAIAQDIGINGKAILGEEINKLSDEELENIANDYDIFARVNPEHKLRIVMALKKLDYVVAVTGDGVNDAPALKNADIGISMGITGTDVSKESSDMILTDDNFHSIVNAVEEGRIVYGNIQKFVAYLLSVNIAEILIILIAILMGWPLPLIAIQILWINLVSDGLPALALSLDPPENNVMLKKPRNPNENLINKPLLEAIIITNLILTLVVLSIFNHYINLDNIIKAQTMVFTTVVVSELVIVYLIRLLFDMPLFKSNKYLFMAVLTSLLLQLLVIYSPLSNYFKTVPLNLYDWSTIFLGLIVIVVVYFLFSWILKAYNKQEPLIRKSLLEATLPEN